MKLQRGSGVLAHITSLPGAFGVGGFGQGAFGFVDFLVDTSQCYWQFLPLGPGSVFFDNSPYMSLSAFAGNPLLIDPQTLVEQGFLAAEFIENVPEFSNYYVEFDRVIAYKKEMLVNAFAGFLEGRQSQAFADFCQQHDYWLADYALFMSLREKFNLKPWSDWPRPLARRDKAAISEAREELATRILFHKFGQFCFFSQLATLREYANGKGIQLIGDIPIYVSLDSADVWANQDCFCLDKNTLQPTHVAGVPPDYFSDTGQRWGNPLYRWKLDDGKDNDKLYAWWKARFKQLFKLVDVCRIDHFRGFESFWQIPADEETAINGKWVKGPGLKFFKEMAKEIGQLPIIAEDLGIITPEVAKLREVLGFPGMKILQFAFDSDVRNLYLPHNFKSANCVVYTGTHDNNTSLGWYMTEANAATRERVCRYAHSDGSDIHWDFIRLAMASVADVAIIPLQDILGFGADCRMNQPGVSEGNWRWRLAEQFLTDAIKDRLRDITCFYAR